MDQFGNDFDSTTGSVMSRKQLEDQRRKRGECVTCGRKCFQKKLFKTIPITDHGRVLNGRCLNCHPLDASENPNAVIPAVSKIATSQDLERFSITQSNLARMQGGGGHPAAAAAAAVAAAHRQSTRTVVSQPLNRSTSRDSSSYRRAQSARSLPSVHRINASATSRSTSGSGNNFGDASSVVESTTVVSMPNPRSQYESSLAPLPPPPPPPPIASPSAGSFRSNVSRESPDIVIGDGQSFSNHHSSIPQPVPGVDEFPLHFHEREVSDNYGDSAREIPLDDDPYYRPPSRGNVEISQSSIRSNESAESYYDKQQGRILNRGGAFSRQALPPVEHTVQRTYNPARHSNHENAERSSRYGSSRSLDSSSSYDDPSNSSFAGTHSQHQHLQHQQRLQPHKEHPEQHPSQYNHHPHPAINNSSHSARSLTETEHVDDTSSLPMNSDHYQHSPAATNHDEAQEHPGLVHLHAARSDFVEILNVMRDYPRDLDVQSAALHELSEVELSEADNMALGQIGGIHVICKAMSEFPDALALQTAGCRAVWNASGTAQNQHDFIQENVLDVILHDMETFLENGSLQEQAMAALANLAALPDNLEIMVERGVVELVVQSMNKHGEAPQVQLKGCLVIANLSSHPTNLKHTIMQRGGGNALVLAMVIHQAEAELQEKALRGLRNLSANCDENKVELTNIGGIDGVIGAMRVHRDAASVQEAGAWTLSNLGGNVDSNALIGDCGGVDVILRAMWVHAETVSVVEWCCRALYTMTLNEKNREMALEVGAIAAVINAMQAHSAVVQEMGCAILCSLASDDESKMRIVDEEALDAIVLAMVLYSEEERVQERGCQVLLQLTIPENLRSMQASNAPAVAEAAAQKFPETCGDATSQLLDLIKGYIAQYG